MGKGYYFDKKSGKYVINKKVCRERLFRRTEYGKGQLKLVEDEIANWSHTVRTRYYTRESDKHTFREASIRYIVENQSNKTIAIDEGQLRRLDEWIGSIYIAELNQQHPKLVAFLKHLTDKGRKSKTLRAYVEIVRRVLNACAHWYDDNCIISWLPQPPKFKLPKVTDARGPRPISWIEQDVLLSGGYEHIADACLFIINTGARDREVCQLSWDWELEVPNGLAFLIPDEVVKGQTVGERLLICNSIAAGIIERKRGDHRDIVFTYNSKSILRLNNSAFKNMRKKANLDVTVHDLRHTFGHRLRSCGIDEKIRSELLGHRSGSMTDHYSMADYNEMYQAVERIVSKDLTLPIIKLKRKRDRG